PRLRQFDLFGAFDGGQERHRQAVELASHAPRASLLLVVRRIGEPLPGSARRTHARPGTTRTRGAATKRPCSFAKTAVSARAETAVLAKLREESVRTRGRGSGQMYGVLGQVEQIGRVSS